MKSRVRTHSVTSDMKFPKLVINKKLLPAKAHYFLYYGGIAAILPFLPLLAKSRGIDTDIIGVIYAILPFAIFLSRPIAGSFTDKFQKQRCVLLTSIAIVIACFLGINFMPKLPKSPGLDSVEELNGTLLCDPSKLLFSFPPQPWNSTKRDSITTCNATCNDTSSGSIEYSCSEENLPECSKATLPLTVTFPENSSIAEFDYYSSDLKIAIEHHSTNQSFNVSRRCSKSVSLQCVMQCKRQQKVIHSGGYGYTILNSYHFWLFAITLLVSGIADGVSRSTADAVVYQLLGTDWQLFGIQRVAGTIGWGSIIIIAGVLNEYATERSGELTFYPGIYLCVAILLLDNLTVAFIKISPQPKPKSVSKGLGKLLCNIRVIVFLFAVYGCGILNGIMEAFLFIYLTDLGASPLLLGLARGVQCFGGELPLMLLSGWIIKKIGHANSITITLLAYAVRYISYSFLIDPWMVLPIELLHGICFGIYYPAATAYASIIAPPGLTATLQGINGAFYEGIGAATGSAIGGFMYNNVRGGGSNMFFVFSVFAVVVAIIHGSIQVLLKRYLPQETYPSKNDHEVNIVSRL